MLRGLSKEADQAEDGNGDEAVRVQLGGEMTLRERIIELGVKHGSVRAAARVLGVDHAYLHRLAKGEKTAPSKAMQRKLGVRAVVTYERMK